MEWSQPAQRPGSRRRWVIGCALLVLLLVVGVGACAVLVFRSFGSAFSVVTASGGEIESFTASSVNGRTTITFVAARGIDLGDGPRLACDVVKPTLASTDLAGAEWVLVNRAGDVIASDATPCGP